MYRQKKILFVGTETKLLTLWSRENLTEVVSSISFVDAIVQRFFPDLVIFDAFHESDVKELRRNEKLISVPVLIVGENFSELNNLTSIASLPFVLLCNRCIAETEPFVKRINQLLEKKSTMLPARTASLVKYAILFINKNYSRHLTRETISSQIGIAEDYLTRIFKKEMGMTLWTYLTGFRLNEARKEILRTGDPVSSIAKKCGFDDHSYFDRVFKKRYSVSPRTMRI